MHKCLHAHNDAPDHRANKRPVACGYSLRHQTSVFCIWFCLFICVQINTWHTEEPTGKTLWSVRAKDWCSNGKKTFEFFWPTHKWCFTWLSMWFIIISMTFFFFFFLPCVTCQPVTFREMSARSLSLFLSLPISLSILPRCPSPDGNQDERSDVYLRRQIR